MFRRLSERTPMPQYVNIAAYKFVELEDLPQRKAELLPMCRSLDLRGTILLATEGINLFLAGLREPIDRFLQTLRQHPEFYDLAVKESLSDHQPFNRMLVRIKKEIISMGVESIRPNHKTSPKLPARELKRWLDEGKAVTLLDVRNDYEVDLGTFQNAIPAGIDHFRRFPEVAEKLPDDCKEKPLVMFCTGGIRCEKAGPLMEEQGFREVYQLDGGILKYFEECGGEHYDGDCFVFDQRVAVDPNLDETDYELCFACQAVLHPEDLASDHYNPPDCCPHCYQTPQEQMAKQLLQRAATLRKQTTPLPGSIPYDNVRPMSVPLAFDGQPAIEFLCSIHANLGREYWLEECQQQKVLVDGKPLPTDAEVRAGWRIEHWIPQTTEPDVSNAVQFLYEDESFIAVNKPAPLPMHASGRFHRNTLDHFLRNVYPHEKIRVLHRLDANTTGVVVLARTREAAREIQKQFASGSIEKTYLAKVQGQPQRDQFSCEQPIGNRPDVAGSRMIDADGLEALTRFEVIQRSDDGTSLIECVPVTGRTNQIRLHLRELGFPIVGDPTYQNGDENRDRQSLSPDDPPMCLHAASLKFRHPESGEPFEVRATPPEWWAGKLP